MHFRTHLIASALTGLVLYPRSPHRAALVAAGGVLIDLDHYVLYALRSGDWNLMGALGYDRRRHRRFRPGDTRPRYGSLRSIVHRPLITLPLLWLICLFRPALWPFAIGMMLHLALDVHVPHYDWRAWARAGDRCERCHIAGLDREVYYLVPPHRGGSRWSLANRAVWCEACARDVYRLAHTTPNIAAE